MSTSMTLPRIPTAAIVLIAVACGAPGLPPAGPAPGEVDVGYGSTQPAGEVTGAVTSVTAAKFSGPRPVGLEELLRGRVPGLQVRPSGNGRGYRIRIRGMNSLLRDIDPLIVVDGAHVPAADLGAVLAGLTADDILQVDVLKDVASTVIYGMSGAGGVIIINTRR